MLRLLLLLSLALLAFAPSGLSADPSVQRLLDAADLMPDVEYGKVGDRVLHMDIATPKIQTSAPMPVVLWIHGGGWEGGSYKDSPAIILPLYGFFTASIEYRLSGEAPWPAQLEDCKLAIRWLRANQKKYHINPERFGVWGHSAGGHLAVCLGVAGDAPPSDKDAPYAELTSRVEAVVDWAGPTDFTDPASMNDLLRGLAAKLCGGPITEKEAIWKDASPVLHVPVDVPPVLIFHGELDTVVPIHNSERLKSALKQVHGHFELVRVANGDHGLRSLRGQPPADPDIQIVLRHVIDFFNGTLKQ